MSRGKKATKTVDYDVGYGKPPVETRFRKGQSGNPAGRPRSRKQDGDKSLFNVVMDELKRPLPGSSEAIETGVAVIRSLLVQAVKGQASAQKLVLPLLIAAYDAQPEDDTKPYDLEKLSLDELKTLKELSRKMAR